MSFKNLSKLKVSNPLDSRPYRYKKAVFNFFCPLCSTERAMTTNHRLTIKNFIQISLITIVISAALYPWMALRGVFSFFLVWPLFEGARRLMFRKEVPCPHCGFDASWYKTDVKMARQKVAEFWQSKDAAEQSILETKTESPEAHISL